MNLKHIYQIYDIMTYQVHYNRYGKHETAKDKFACIPLQIRMHLILITLLICLSPTQAQTNKYPQAIISNQEVVMKLYLPDPVNGYYRATRFDWSGIIYSLEYQGHQYFGEWKTTHDPLVHEDITGPVESFGTPGLGYDEAEAGGEFIRIGVGILEKIEESRYVWNKTYKILDHGVWKVDHCQDWIEFRHELKSKAGWGYIYTKKIELMKSTPGFSIRHTLKNTGQKTIDTDQFNHNFFVIDSENTSPDFQVKFPFNITTENDLKGIVKLDRNKLLFTKKLTEGSIWLALKGYGTEAKDHQVELINTKTGAGVSINVNKPLTSLVFWATTTTLCPENFIQLKLPPGVEESWVSNYTLFAKKRTNDNFTSVLYSLINFLNLQTIKMKEKKDFTRRDFIKNTAAAGIAFSIIPSHVLGGSGRVAPSDKLNVALIGCGTQTNAMLGGWLNQEQIQFTSVCDPNKESTNYPLWGASKGEKQGAAGGREVSRRRINGYYAEKLGQGKYKGCEAYADFRELLEKETGTDAVFIMTPDHLHASIALAAMKKKIKVASHKPISNRMNETRVTIDTAKKTGTPTHCFFYQDSAKAYHIKEMLRQGVIGKVKEYHRWTNRPMWPQGSPYIPEPQKIPDGFDWQLWLGPSTDRPYSPAYTNTVFRGWYEFGGGCLADMGHYGMWVDWRILDLGMPKVADASSSFTCEIKDFRSTWVKNNLSYPHASTIRFEVPVNGTNDEMDVFWYEGGIRPAPPKELRALNIEMPRDGYMFVGEKGILWPMGNNDPLLLGVKDGDKLLASIKAPEVELMPGDEQMIESFKGGKPSMGSFERAQTISEAICLGNLSLRMDKRLEWDSQNMKVTNVAEANQYLSREYRKGWEI